MQVKIVAEDRIIQNRIAEALADWEQNKPIQGNLRAEDAMNAIIVFDARVTKLKEDEDMVARAKQALDLELVRDTRLEPVVEELRDLKGVWTALSGIWSQISELRETPWTSIQPRKLRQQLDQLVSSTRELPSRMRQYAAFEFVQDTLRQHAKAAAIVGELKSEALRERHWRQLYKALRVASQYTPSSMTLGTVWDLGLKRNEATIKEIIVQAQGEMALEEFLKQVCPRPVAQASESWRVAPGQGDLVRLRPRLGQLSKQDAPHPRLGRPLQQVQREPQLACRYAPVALL
jgi:dynein heavy chain 1